MGSYQVLPDGSGWVVEKHGRTVSNHRKKRRATQAARREASPGDQIEIRRANGTVQNVVTVR
jgi:hypothetical protein